jgi:DivIVA domain-containing protein
VTFRLVVGIAGFAYVAIIAARNLSRRGPRPRIDIDEWLPRGWLFLISLTSVALLVGGGFVVVAPNQNFRLGGALAMAGGAALLWLIIRYVHRPVRDVEPPSRNEVLVTLNDARLPPFAHSLRGYDQDEVDAFFKGILSKPPGEIAQIRFKTRWRGYDLQEVDRALDAWSLRQSNPPVF